MAARTIDERIERHEKLALKAPQLTVLSDRELSSKEAYLDSFKLAALVGPIYDILRHDKTKTPMAIAVYGDWGTGKTTAMKWLHSLLSQWNRKGADKNKVTVRPVWFYPWKYHTKEDVWRGLVAEVIINSIDVKTATPRRVINAAKQFGLFLGRSFVHTIGGITLKLQTPGETVGAELDLGAIKEILDEYRQVAEPEKAYLNDFEDSLRTWIDSTIGPNERMVIFIDDLDRCMPDVALQVLEALKLYLNIEKLIFVVGVDPTVIDQLVKKLYEKLGLSLDKSANYLAKMFQVEVDLVPTEQQIKNFLDDRLHEVEMWESELSEDEQAIIRERILILAEQNPREVKRLINSALIRGAGAIMAKEHQL